MLIDLDKGITDDEFLSLRQKSKEHFLTNSGSTFTRMKSRLQQAILTADKMGLDEAKISVAKYPRSTSLAVVEWAKGIGLNARYVATGDSRDLFDGVVEIRVKGLQDA